MDSLKPNTLARLKHGDVQARVASTNYTAAPASDEMLLPAAASDEAQISELLRSCEGRDSQPSVSAHGI